MNVSLHANTQNSYLFSRKYSSGSGLEELMGDRTANTSAQEKARQLRQQVRSLNQSSQDENPYTVNSKDKVKDLLGISGSAKSDKDKKAKKSLNYNYKEVANKILRAKTSVSAGQAVLSAKRKVLEVRRKMSGSDADSGELQAALTHAKRMEMAARKKKHHLELEELVEHTQDRDEKLDKMDEAAADMKNSLVEVSEEEVAKQEDAIFEQREEMLDEVEASAADSGVEIPEDMMSELNEILAEFGEEELKALEEEMELLENMEVIDPHMSEEDLEELKRKHRNAENRAIMKANMDYLKSMIKHTLEKGSAVSGSSSAAASAAVGASASAGGVSMASIDVSVGGEMVPGAAEPPAIDVQV